ncbi:MAG: hypothetical protein ABFD60_07875 [Bryobacteraceae bacterium]
MGSSLWGAFGRAIDPTGMIIKDPEPPAPLPAPGPAPTETSTEVQEAKASVNRRRRSLLKLNPTGGSGDLSEPPSVRKSLLGQA